MIGWFIAGAGAGIIAAAIVSGLTDRISEWRKKKNEQKSIRNHFSHRGGGDHA